MKKDEEEGKVEVMQAEVLGMIRELRSRLGNRLLTMDQPGQRMPGQHRYMVSIMLRSKGIRH